MIKILQYGHFPVARSLTARGRTVNGHNKCLPILLTQGNVTRIMETTGSGNTHHSDSCQNMPLPEGAFERFRKRLGNHWVQLLLLVIAFMVAWQGQQRVHLRETETSGWLIYACACVLYALACIGASLYEKKQPTAQPENPTWPGREALVDILSMPVRIGAFVLGFLVLLYPVYQWSHDNYQIRLVWPFGIAVLLLVAAFSRPCTGWSAIHRFCREYGHFLILAAIVFTAAVLRFWRLEELPPGIWFDEAQTGLEARHILQSAEYTSIRDITVAKGPNLFYILTAWCLPLFGDNLWTLRLAPALTGVLSVLAVYGLGRYAFGPMAGLAAAFFIAVGKWSINFSRYNMPNITVPLVCALVFWALLWAIRERRNLAYALAGLTLGLGLHLHTSFRLVPFIAVAFLAVYTLCNRREWKRTLMGGLLMAAICIAVVSPQIVYAAKNWEAFSGRMSETSVVQPGKSTEQIMADIKNNIYRHVRMLHADGDRNGRHGLRGDPKLDDLTGVLFLFGLAECVVLLILGQARSGGDNEETGGNSPPRTAYALMLFWLVLGFLGGVLSLAFEAPQSARTMALISVCSLMAALPVRRFWNAASSLAGGKLRWAAVLVLIPGMVFCAKDNAETYFIKQMNDSETYDAFACRDTDIARLICGLDREHTVIASTTFASQQLAYLLPEPFLNIKFNTWEHFPVIDDNPANDFVYILENWQTPLPRDYWLHYYPSARFVQEKTPSGEDAFYHFHVTPGQVRDAHGLSMVRYSPAGDVVQNVVQQTPEWPEMNQLSSQGPDTVVWRGSLMVNFTRPLRFSVKGAQGGSIRIDDHICNSLRPDSLETEILQLPRGIYDLVITAQASQSQPDAPLCWMMGSSQFVPVPSRFLFSVPAYPHGLRGRYFDRPDWQGTPAIIQRDPLIDFRWHNPPLTPDRWSAEWDGYLWIENAGRYVMHLQSNDYCELHVDGYEMLLPNGGQQGRPVELSAGAHMVCLRYRQSRAYAEFRWKWEQPGKAIEAVPQHVLYPTRLALETAGHTFDETPAGIPAH